METASIIAILVALLGGTCSGLIPFLITRHDSMKKDQNKDVLDAIDTLSKQLEERNAVSCRVRILRFYDEMRSDLRHTKDSWDQCLSDITTYEHYCENHPSFKNNQTQATVEYIMGEYHERLAKNDFA